MWSNQSQNVEAGLRQRQVTSEELQPMIAASVAAEIAAFHVKQENAAATEAARGLTAAAAGDVPLEVYLSLLGFQPQPQP